METSIEHLIVYIRYVIHVECINIFNQSLMAKTLKFLYEIKQSDDVCVMIPNQIEIEIVVSYLRILYLVKKTP